MSPLRPLATAAILVLLLSGRSFGVILDRVVAVVDHDAITLSELKKNMHGEDEKKALENLIEKKLVEKEAQRLGIAVLDSEVDEALQDVRRRHGLSEEDLKKNLESQRLTLDAYRQQLRDQIERAKIINKELRLRITISDEEMKEYYQKKSALFFRPEEVKIQHILLRIPPGASAREKKAIRAKAAGILKNVRAGKDFSRLARVSSEDQLTASSGGDLGFVRRGELQVDFEKTAFALKPGEAGLVETQYGFHIVKVVERHAPRPVPFEEVENQVREALIQEKAEKIFHDWVEELKEKAVIEVKL